MNVVGIAKRVYKSYRPETGDFSGFHFRISFLGRDPPENGVPNSDEIISDKGIRIRFSIRRGRQKACNKPKATAVVLDTRHAHQIICLLSKQHVS